MGWVSLVLSPAVLWQGHDRYAVLCWAPVREDEGLGGQGRDQAGWGRLYCAGLVMAECTALRCTALCYCIRSRFWEGGVVIDLHRVGMDYSFLGRVIHAALGHCR